MSRMASLVASRGFWIVPVIFLSLGLPPTLTVAEHPPTALVPVEVVASRFQDLQGLAWCPDQALYASDREAGVIYRLSLASPEGVRITVRHAGLRKPAGLICDSDAVLAVAEEAGGQLLRLNGIPTPLWTGLFHPTWLALSPDGTLFVTAQEGSRSRLKLQGQAVEDGFQLLRRRPGSAGTEVMLSGLHQPGGLWIEPAGTLLLTLDKLSGESEQTSPTLLRIAPTHSPTSSQGFTTLLGPGVKRPVGPVPDALESLILGAWYPRPQPLLGAPPDGDPQTGEGVLLRLRAGPSLSLLGTGFGEIRGLALEPQGHLYVATKETIYRLRAPAAPTLEHPPLFTNQSPLALHGSAPPASEVSALGGQAPAAVEADPLTGAFAVPVPLRANAENPLRIYSTSRQGMGLPSAPAEVTVLHDNRAPTVDVTRPAPATFVHGSVEVAVEASETILEGEAWSGVSTLLLRQGETPLPTAPHPTPEISHPHRVFAVWDTTRLTDGPHDLTAEATDRAGNTARSSITLTVDNTPPAVFFTAPASGAMVSGLVDVTVIGTDATAGVEALTLHVDGGLFQTSAVSPLTGLLDTRLLGPGPHTLTATAQDHAGNTDSTLRTILVQSLAVRITEPVDGAIITQDRMRVTGTVQGSGEVGVVVNGSPASVLGGTFAAIIPVPPDTTSVTAVATTISGATATSSVRVSVIPTPPPPVTLEVFPAGGPPPLRVTFRLQNNTGRLLVFFELDFDGDGSVDLTSATFDGPQATYTGQGLFLAKLRATDDQGQVCTAETLVSVGTAPPLEPKWEGMKDALRRGDIAAALAFIHSTTRVRYEATFQRLTPAQLANIDQALTTIVPVELGPNGAEYEMRRTRDGQTLSYAVWFQVDVDGIWRLRLF